MGGLAQLAAGAAILGLAPILVRSSGIGPLSTAFWRLALAVPVLIAWRWRRSPPAIVPPLSAGAMLGLGIAAGAAFALDLATWHWSIKLTSVANATLLSNLAPVGVTLVAWAFLAQRPRGLFLAGMLVAIIGSCLLMGPDASIGHGRLLGDLLGLISAAFYGTYQLLLARLTRSRPTSWVMLVVAVTGMVLLLPAAVISEGHPWPRDGRGWAAVLALALVCHLGGQGLITRGFAKVPVTLSSVILFLQPVVAAVLAWLVLSELMTPWQVLGGMAVLVGIWLAHRGSAPMPIRDGALMGIKVCHRRRADDRPSGSCHGCGGSSD